jgi:hypothetical protein
MQLTIQKCGKEAFGSCEQLDVVRIRSGKPREGTVFCLLTRNVVSSTVPDGDLTRTTCEATNCRLLSRGDSSTVDLRMVDLAPF